MEPHPPAHPLSSAEHELHLWSAATGYMPQTTGPIPPYYYYGDGRYPPPLQDYYDTFAPVPYR